MPAAKKAALKKLPTQSKKIASPVKKGIVSGVKKPEPTARASSKKELLSEGSSKTSLPKAKNIKVVPAKPVVLPKITTTKSRRYEPEFTKSVLDQAPPENNGPSMRYSDTELNEFKELIQRKLETAKKELGYLQGLITRKDEMGGDESDNRYMTMEDGSLSMEREQLSQMASRQITFIDHLEKAMMRIENKTYGICRVTGKLIDKARLRAVPHATLCIEAKMGIVK
jgi:RNA polymerase-binding transcription factor DksA